MTQLEKLLQLRNRDFWRGEPIPTGCALERYMYGRSVKNAQPTIIGFVSSQRFRRNAKEILEDYDFQIDPRGIGIDYYSSHPVYFGGQALGSTASKSRSSDQPTGLPQFIGTAIQAGNTAFTLGGPIVVDDKIVGLTVAHAIEAGILEEQASKGIETWPGVMDIRKTGGGRLGVTHQMRHFDTRLESPAKDLDWAVILFDKDQNQQLDLPSMEVSSSDPTTAKGKAKDTGPSSKLKYPALQEGSNKPGELHPFWRPANFWDDPEDFDSNDNDEYERGAVTEKPPPPKETLSQKFRRTLAMIPTNDSRHNYKTVSRDRKVVRTASGSMRVAKIRSRAPLGTKGMDWINYPGKIVQEVTESAHVVVCTRNGTERGMIMGDYSLVALPGRRHFQRMWVVKMNRNISPGDCGSWVLDSSQESLYGHLIAGRQGTGVAYLVLARDIFEDIRIRCKASEVRLPTRQELQAFSNPSQGKTRLIELISGPFKIPDQDGASDKSSSSLDLMHDDLPVNPVLSAIPPLALKASPLVSLPDHGSKRLRASSTAASPTQSSLRSQLGDVQYEPWNDYRYFVADNDLNQLITEESVYRHLKEKDLILDQRPQHRIHESAPKLFAILVSEKLERHIFNFLDEGISDDDLPFVRLSLTHGGGEHSQYQLCSRRHPETVIKCTLDWNQIDIRRICQTQWSFLAPVFDFTSNAECYDFDDNCVLPFIEDSESSNPSTAKRSEGGSTNCVRKVIIHAAHLKISDRGIRNKSEFIVKQLPDTVNEKYMRSEVGKFKAVSHEHMISVLAAYSWRGRCHLVFPYAESNLREYWQMTPLPRHSSVTVSWIIRQCAGITNALKRIHEEGMLSLHGYHGNIKPENIFWFSHNSDPGLLVLGHFGEGKGPKSMISSSIASIDHPGEWPPQGSMKQLRNSLRNSQAFDVWSLGCVFLEFSTWFIDGREGILELLLKEVQDLYGDPKGPRYRTEEKIRVWVKGLIKISRSSPVMNDFLDMIAGGMLVGEPQQRMSVVDVDEALQKIAMKASLGATGAVEQTQQMYNPKSRAPTIFHRFGEQPLPTQASMGPGLSEPPLGRQHELS
ncbi:hypothetical protein BKA61DRAFT_671985 [Leptodontidium sp. MPI-SDFR-AT-0119]|nr:hypothetical protein BKA61DRAFT_671985 [Leptodontidium sp. MPI-SDFR-AT-0119]